MRLQGKTAFITGGNSGIGLATARLFVAEGARVVITGRNRDTLDAAVAELGDKVVAIQADLQDESAIERSVSEAVGAREARHRLRERGDRRGDARGQDEHGGLRERHQDQRDGCLLDHSGDRASPQ